MRFQRRGFNSIEISRDGHGAEDSGKAIEAEKILALKLGMNRSDTLLSMSWTRRREKSEKVWGGFVTYVTSVSGGNNMFSKGKI